MSALKILQKNYTEGTSNKCSKMWITEAGWGRHSVRYPTYFYVYSLTWNLFQTNKDKRAMTCKRHMKKETIVSICMNESNLQCFLQLPWFTYAPTNRETNFTGFKVKKKKKVQRKLGSQ